MGRVGLLVCCAIFLTLQNAEGQQAFWQGIGTGLHRTAQDVISRVSDNIETTVDQLGDAMDPLHARLSDRIESRVNAALPPWLRDGEPTNLEQERPIEAIMGNLGGVDDGLEVFYEGDRDNVRPIGQRTDQTPSGSVDAEFVPTPEGNRPGFIENPDNMFGFDLDFRDPFFRNPTFPFNSPVNWFRFTTRAPWWKGPNVCQDREEIDESENNKDGNDTGIVTTDNGFFFSSGHFSVSTCQEMEDKYTCTTKTSNRGMKKTVKVTYRCCHGFLREGSACIKVELQPMPDTLQTLKATDFLSLAKAADLMSLFEEGNLTVFAPTNEAIQDYTADLEQQNEIANVLQGRKDTLENENALRIRRSTAAMGSTVKSHLVSGFLYAGDLKDEQILDSVDSTPIRINFYSTRPPTATANCARMVKMNQHSSNGVVHSIDRVLEPVTKSINDVISHDPRFSILKSLVDNLNMTTELSEPGQKTLLAPTDEAFNSLDPLSLEELLEGGSCLETVIQNHILPNVICSAAVNSKVKTLNSLKNFLYMDVTESGDMTVEDSKIIEKDIMVTNGVIHVIDKPITPDEAKPVIEVLEQHNLTRFLDLLEAADMKDYLKKLSDVTVFAPSNSAVDLVPEDVMNTLMDNKEVLADILKYHITKSALHPKDISNNHIADTHSGHPLRINLYNGSPLLTGIFSQRRPVRLTAGCSRVSSLNSRACGAVVHVVEQMLEIPKQDVMDYLEADDDFALFTQMIKDAGIEDTLRKEGPFTVLAPSDYVFRTLPEEELQFILGDNATQKELVKRHSLEEHICCSGINNNNWLYMDHKRAMDGSLMHVRRTHRDHLMAGPSRITNCGVPTHNGVVHTVNHIMYDVRPPSSQNHKTYEVFSVPGLTFDIFGA